MGACCNAPMLQINDDYFEDLTPETMEKLLQELREGREVKVGSQVGRFASARADGPHTLTDLPDRASPSGILLSDSSDDEEEEEAPTPQAAPSKPEAPKPEVREADTAAGSRPAGLAAPRDGKADNLKKIKGLGPKAEEGLNALGVFHFDQIAAWSAAEVDWVGSELGFSGRIEREDWVGQAKALAAEEGKSA